MEHPLVLFDGVCNLCNASVQFIIDRDPKAQLRFASLQSVLGVSIQKQHGLDPTQLDSILFVQNGKIYQRSDAALQIASYFGGLWKILGWFRFIPRPLRDLVYNWIAQNRYRWFGKEAACRIPTPALRERFLS